MGAVYLPLLFSLDRCAASLVAVFSSDLDPGRAAGVSRDLLLLPQGVLPGIFPRSAGMCGWRTQRAEVSRRNGVSVHSAKPASILFLSSRAVSVFSVVRRGGGFPFSGGIWHRRWIAGDVSECAAAFDVHLFVPLAAASGGREIGLFFLRHVWAPEAFGVALGDVFE